MTLEELFEKVREWDLQGSTSAEADSHFSNIINQLYFHAEKEWRVYLPATHTEFHPSYMERLAAWIGNLTNETDQKTLLEYAGYISFFSHDDFVALYRTALDREVVPWIVSQIGARLEPDGNQALADLVHREIHCHTWFCPVTDSMDINEFHKVNHLQGVAHRPCFTTQQMLAEHPTNPNRQIIDGLVRYMANPSNDPQNDPRPQLTRIVLLEDIVGSGTQSLNSIRWSLNNFNVPILFIPLILCPNGVDALHQEENLWRGKLKVKPVIELRRSELLGPERKGHAGWPITEKMEDLTVRYASRLSNRLNPFGFQGTGCSLAMFTNTPDNTLPLVHNKPCSGTWEPLFPRVNRGD